MLQRTSLKYFIKSKKFIQEFFFIDTRVSDLLGRLTKIALDDRGYKGGKEIRGVEIKIPASDMGAKRHMKRHGKSGIPFI